MTYLLQLKHVEALYLLLFIPLLLAPIWVIASLKIYSLPRLILPIIRFPIQYGLLTWLLFKIHELNNLFLYIAAILFVISVNSFLSAWMIWQLHQEKDEYGVRLKEIPLLSFFLHALINTIIALIPVLIIWHISLFNGNYFHNMWIWLLFTATTIHFASVSIHKSGKFFITNLIDQREKIEAALSLGLNAFQSFHWLIKDSLVHSLSAMLQSLALLGAFQLSFVFLIVYLSSGNLLLALYGQIALSLGSASIALISVLLTIRSLYKKFHLSFLPEKINSRDIKQQRKRIRIR